MTFAKTRLMFPRIIGSLHYPCGYSIVGQTDRKKENEIRTRTGCMAQLYLGDEELVAKRAAASYSLYIYARESIHITARYSRVRFICHVNDALDLAVYSCWSYITLMMPALTLCFLSSSAFFFRFLFFFPSSIDCICHYLFGGN